MAALVSFSANVAAQKIVFKPGDPGVQPPVLIKEIKPSYAAHAMHERIEGTVVLETVIDTKGRPKQIKVTRPLQPGLDEKAKAALSKWRLTPAKKGGKSVEYLLQVPMTFDLRSGHRGPVYEKGEAGIIHPIVVKDVKPRYTRTAMIEKVEGTIELEGIVEADGSVSSVRILKPLHPEFNGSAIDAFLAMRFKPAMRTGVPVAYRVRIEYTFDLR